MARKNVPVDVGKAKMAEYVAAELLSSSEADEMEAVFEQMRGVQLILHTILFFILNQKLKSIFYILILLSS